MLLRKAHSNAKMVERLLMKDILSLECVVLGAPVTSVEQAFEAIGQVVRLRGPARRAEIAQRLGVRESHGTTAIGYGLAIPHAQIKGLKRPVAAFLRPRRPIPFEAPDGKPVSDLLVLLVPKPAAPQHFALLADVRHLLSDRDFRDVLTRCIDPLEVWQLFEQWPFYTGAARLRPLTDMQQCNARP